MSHYYIKVERIVSSLKQILNLISDYAKWHQPIFLSADSVKRLDDYIKEAQLHFPVHEEDDRSFPDKELDEV